jgi:hypothetical protein
MDIYNPDDFNYIPDDSVFMTLNINTKTTKKIEKDPFKDYQEIKVKYLKFFFGCWVKYINKETKEYFSGGILTELNYQYKSVFLRPLRNEKDERNVIKIHPVEKYKFYVKNDTENFRAYMNILKEYDKIRQILNSK